MPGLLNRGMPPDDAAPRPLLGSVQTAPAEAPTETGDEEQTNVTPEEQAAKDKFVNNAFLLIYDKKVLPTILNRLNRADSPERAVEALADTTAMVVMRLEDSAAKKGRPLSPDILMHGGKEVLEDLADLSARIGIHDYTPEEIEAAVYRAMDEYREVRGKQGGLNQEAINQEFQSVLAADREGRLGELIPGLEARTKPAAAERRA